MPESKYHKRSFDTTKLLHAAAKRIRVKKWHFPFVASAVVLLNLPAIHSKTCVIIQNPSLVQLVPCFGVMKLNNSKEGFKMIKGRPAANVKIKSGFSLKFTSNLFTSHWNETSSVLLIISGEGTKKYKWVPRDNVGRLWYRLWPWKVKCLGNYQHESPLRHLI